jgi:hypothetical protein
MVVVNINLQRGNINAGQTRQAPSNALPFVDVSEQAKALVYWLALRKYGSPALCRDAFHLATPSSSAPGCISNLRHLENKLRTTVYPWHFSENFQTTSLLPSWYVVQDHAVATTLELTVEILTS